MIIHNINHKDKVPSMDYSYIEGLIESARLGDEKAKEALASEFTPLILKLSRKLYINSYDLEDIVHEGYRTLFKCLQLYDPKAHRFVAYAASAIRNNVKYLLRSSTARKGTEGSNALILDAKLINTLGTNKDHTEAAAINKVYKERLKIAVKTLDFKEQELISIIYSKGHSLKKYAELKGITYYAADKRKTEVLYKLSKALNKNDKKSYLN